MRHLLIAAAMVVGALFITATASTLIERSAMARHHQKGDYQPPTVATSPTGVKKSDASTTSPHRSRATTTETIDRAG